MLPLAYSTSIYATVFWVAMAIWYIPEITGPVSQRAWRVASAQDRGSYAFLLAILFAGLILGLWLVAFVLAATITWNRVAIYWIGIACMLLGVALRWHAIRTLGRFFTRDVAVRGDQTVVQTGPYRLIRHPAYSGTLLTLLGT